MPTIKLEKAGKILTLFLRVRDFIQHPKKAHITPDERKL